MTERDAPDRGAEAGSGVGGGGPSLEPWLDAFTGDSARTGPAHDWIENLLGLDMHSADQIVPEWQNLEVGETMRGKPGGAGMRLEILEPERLLSWRSEDGDWVWTFELEEQDRSTRLLSRNRIKMGGASAGQRLGMLVMEPGSLLMERKMLRVIKDRAERMREER